MAQAVSERLNPKYDPKIELSARLMVIHGFNNYYKHNFLSTMEQRWLRRLQDCLEISFLKWDFN